MLINKSNGTNLKQGHQTCYEVERKITRQIIKLRIQWHGQVLCMNGIEIRQYQQ